MSDDEELRNYLATVEDILFPVGAPATYGVLSTSSDGDTPLHIAAINGDLRAVHLLVDAGAIVDARGEMGETPLCRALIAPHHLVVEFLLHSGANPDVLTDFGTTPRNRIMASGDRRLAELLPSYRSTS